MDRTAHFTLRKVAQMRTIIGTFPPTSHWKAGCSEILESNYSHCKTAICLAKHLGKFNKLFQRWGLAFTGHRFSEHPSLSHADELVCRYEAPDRGVKWMVCTLSRP